MGIRAIGPGHPRTQRPARAPAYADAVATVSRTRTVEAPVQAVWDVLADFGAISSWAANVDHSCILEHDPHGPVGTSRRVQVGRNTLVERITEAAAPNTLAYDIEGLSHRLRRVANRWTLTPALRGGTAVTLTSTVEIGTNPLARVAERVLCPVLARQSDTMLTGLAQRVEATHD
jgi:uncharacterized protein YndB with AHSA1/START domain